ncbi:MAG: helix-turn-helix domain-containing protein [Nanoarchaeota archaeon]|nr:helix-turn-helix domain-containing protein [Nanoarchaeota archaeon]
MEQELKDAGLSDAEIKIYLALLKKGQSSVSTLSKYTGHDRTHIYDVLEKLREKGLISEFQNLGNKAFKALNPEKILDFLEERYEKMKLIIPALQSINPSSNENISVELLKGKEGIKLILKDILRDKKNYLMMAVEKEHEEILEYSLPSFLKKAEMLGLKERVICNKREKISKINKGQYKFLGNDKNRSPTSFFTYGNKVALIIWEFPCYVILIQSEKISNTYKKYFETFWKLAKK